MIWGGATAHGSLSGEVDFVLGDEEAVIETTRDLLASFTSREHIPRDGRICRSGEIPQTTIPESSAILIGHEAIESNVDQGKFFETRKDLKYAGGVLTGYAQLAKQPVVMAMASTDYGIHHGRSFKKIQLAAAAAEDFGFPFIVAAGANWDRLSPVVRAETIYHQYEMRRMIRTIRVPKISLVMGPRSLERSIHEMIDLRCYVRRGTETKYELRRASMLCHGMVDSFAEAMDWCADILRYLPRPWELDVGVRGSGFGVREEEKETKPGTRNPEPVFLRRLLHTDDLAGRRTPEIAEILPQNLTQPYEMREVINCLFDRDSFREFAADDSQPLIVGLATIGGGVVGVIADAPNVEGGAQTVIAISKFTRFHRLCERFGLPIIELNDSPAFRPGREQEQSGIQGEGGKSIREEVLSPIPKVAVTLRQNYGGRYIHANLVTLGPPRQGLIAKGSRLGVMGAEGAVGVLLAKKLATITDPMERDKAKAEAVKDYERSKLDPAKAVELGYARAIVPFGELRREIVATLLAENF